MNTGKQINVMVVLLFVLLVAAGAYTLWDPFRADSAEDKQLEKTIRRGADTFALNCRLCHGDRGQGGPAGGRLPAAPPLDRPDLQGFDSQGNFDPVLKEQNFKFIYDTIVCGRVGTAMPAWGEDQGGILNEEQIRQLAVLITEGRWDVAQEFADEIDAKAVDHATVQMPDGTFNANETELIVSNANPFSLGQYIRIGEGEEEERLRILPLQLVVERGVDGTEPAEHEAGAAIRRDDGAEAVASVAEKVDAETTGIPITMRDEFLPGEVLQIDDERVRVVDVVQGIPTTGQQLAQAIDKEARRLLVSDADGIEIGAIVRLEDELIEVIAINDQGDPGITLEDEVSARDTVIAVSDPAFFRPDYVFRLDDELVRVVGPVETGQTLGESIGRAEETFQVSGIDGIEPGMVIRLGSELMRVTAVEPARARVERGASDPNVEEAEPTTPAAHNAGSAVLRLPQEEGETRAERDTGQRLLEDVSADATTFVLTGSAGVLQGDTYQVGDELVVIQDIEPARITVERGYNGSERQPHGRRLPIFEANFLEVERGVDGTGAAAHDAGTPVFVYEVEVRRAVQGSEREQHSKGTELFLGNRLIVERGVFNTEPRDHPNGAEVRDFPTAPEPAGRLLEACGRRISERPTPAGPTPTPAPVEGPTIDVSLVEFAVEPDPPSIVDGLLSFVVKNDGAIPHNFRVIRTDLAPDELPTTASGQVDESAVDVVAASRDLNGGESETVTAELPPGNYVLICNIPGHYLAGMRVAFEVQAP